jgi:hypothetical protein
MTLKLKLNARMARAVVVAAAAGAIGLIPAVPAMAAPSAKAPLTSNGSVHFGCGGATGGGGGTGGENTCDQFIGAKATVPWKVHETSAGYSASTSVSFTFREGSDQNQSLNNQYYFALPVAIDPTKVVIHNEAVAGGGDTAPSTCLANAGTAGYEHPSSISVDWANQSFSMVVPTPAATDDTVEYCFDPSIDIGWPLTPTQDSTEPQEYVVFYAEPGNPTDESDFFGDTSDGQTNAALEQPDTTCDSPCHESSSFMHFFGHSGGLTVDLSQAGEGVMGPGLSDTPYDVVLQGNQGSTYSLTAESATGVADPRVSITCFSGCTANDLSEVRAVFSVSCGVLDHFVIVAKNTGSAALDIAEINGVTAFTVSAKACPAAASAPAAVIPALPNAGHPLMPVQYDWMLLLLIPAIGVLGWISVKPD